MTRAKALTLLQRQGPRGSGRPLLLPVAGPLMPTDRSIPIGVHKSRYCLFCLSPDFARSFEAEGLTALSALFFMTFPKHRSFSQSTESQFQF